MLVHVEVRCAKFPVECCVCRTLFRRGLGHECLIEDNPSALISKLKNETLEQDLKIEQLGAQNNRLSEQIVLLEQEKQAIQFEANQLKLKLNGSPDSFEAPDHQLIEWQEKFAYNLEHSASVTCLIQIDKDHFATGDKTGTVKTWNFLAKQSVSTCQISLEDRQELKYLSVVGCHLVVGVTCFEGQGVLKLL